MSQLTGTVVKRNLDKGFGWIKYEPENDDDDDEIYFVWDQRRDGEFPGIDTGVTFTKESDPEKPGSYIAKNVKVKNSKI